MKLKVKDIKGNYHGDLEVKFPMVEDGKGTQAVHDTVVGFQAAQRMGTASTKTMGEVAGTGKKPWRQKGTGRARAGSFASPLWRGGGVVFGPKPRDFAKKVSRKTRQLALRKALSERLKAGDVVVVDDLQLDSPKTKNVAGMLSALELSGRSVTIVSAGADAEPVKKAKTSRKVDKKSGDARRNLALASRNIPNVALTTSDSLNTYDVLRPEKLLFTRSAFEKVGERLAKD